MKVIKSAECLEFQYHSTIDLAVNSLGRYGLVYLPWFFKAEHLRELAEEEAEAGMIHFP